MIDELKPVQLEYLILSINCIAIAFLIYHVLGKEHVDCTFNVNKQQVLVKVPMPRW